MDMLHGDWHFKESYEYFTKLVKRCNLDEVFWDDLDELSVSRDEDYNIKITCVRNLNKFKINNQRNAIPQNDFVLGEVVPSGRLEIKINEDYTVTFSPMYFNGYESKLDKTNYRLSCYTLRVKVQRILL